MLERTQLVSIGIDSAKALSLDAARLGITAPLLSDADGGVSKAYGLPLKWSGKPGHIFVLAGKDGLVKWVKDYAIPGQNAVMYVNPDELAQEVRGHLETPGQQGAVG